ncbi:WASH complex subunit 3-like [Bacillus rossius redtenbacheri]|uniref:WASH complex subunit 3-like n=1 Tax=Bacillus rossius redtenbacheri TaxID=93214 RepID=UPI002FDEF1DC
MMANREMDDAARQAPEDESSQMSPQPPTASPAPSPDPSSSPRSPPVMLATMTPVSVVGLQQKDFDDDDDDDVDDVDAKDPPMYDDDEDDEDPMLHGGRAAVDLKLFQQPQRRGGEEAQMQMMQMQMAEQQPSPATTTTTTTVSVVVQQPGTLLGQAYGQQAGTTVLVLSELVDDMPQVIGLR